MHLNKAVLTTPQLFPSAPTDTVGSNGSTTAAVSSDQFIARGVEGRSWQVREGIPPGGELATLGQLGSGNTGTVFDPSFGVKNGAAQALILPLRRDALNLGQDSSMLLVLSLIHI